MWSWVCLGGWCGPSLMLSKLGLRPTSAFSPFDSVRCTLDGVIELTTKGFSVPGAYLPVPTVGSRKIVVPDPVSIWLLFRSQHIGFAHVDLNRPDTLQEIQDRIHFYEASVLGLSHSLQSVWTSPLGAERMQSPAPPRLERVTFLRTIMADDPAEELKMLPQLHAAIRARTQGRLRFRTVLIMHDQEAATQPVCCFPEEDRVFHSPCVVWNLKRKLNSSSSSTSLGSSSEVPLAPPSLFDQCHTGYETILSTMSEEASWESVTAAGQRYASASDYLALKLSSSPLHLSRTDMKKQRSGFLLYQKLSRICGVPAVRGTCVGFGSTHAAVSEDDPCLYCGSVNGHALETSDVCHIAGGANATRHRPWTEQEVQELLLALAVHGGDEVAAAEAAALYQTREAEDTWKKLKELLNPQMS